MVPPCSACLNNSPRLGLSGLAWNVHKEDFFQNQNWLNFFEIAFSIGNPGNQNFDAYISMNVYKYATGYPESLSG